MKLKNLIIVLRNHMIIIFTFFFLAVQPLCIDDERTALLRFKASLEIDKSASQDPSAYPKTASWAMERPNCCSWDGVSCEDKTGHVISLDLNSSLLYGSIDASSTLFYLTSLERLNLADNNFNHSRISPELGNLSSLSHLNLSGSSFVGLPLEISLLSNLSSLDLTYVNISSEFPDFLANLSSLTRLVMKNCGVFGEFPEEIFHLPKLELLNAQHNPSLTGRFPDFKPGSPLKTLWFCGTNFSGNVPSSIKNLKSLEFLSAARAKLSGFLPSSIGRLNNLTYLDLSYNNFLGEVPLFLQNLTKLKVLWFGGNQFTGQIPPWIGTLTELTILSLARNKLSGPVPRSLSRLKNLQTLNIFENELDGAFDFETMFHDMTSLAELRLDGNKLSVINTTGTNFGRFEILGMSFCNLTRFPDFLRYQDRLRYLDLGGNDIHGPIPEWIWSTSKETLAYLALNDNFLTSIGGKFDDLFCKLPSLQLLDLSNNLLSEFTLPKCLERNPNNNLLSVLNLRNNSLRGLIPQICSNNATALKMLDLSHNKLEGPIPRSMRNCSMLESFNVGNNRLSDIFPHWLGNLPKLRLLILRSNGLHGEITVKSPSSADSQFSNLRVIDVSHNNFSGKLPSEYFEYSWKAMKVPDSSGSYLKAESSFEAVKRIWSSEYTYSTTITIKGVEVRYGKIQEILVVVDLSSNGFAGEIPDSLGGLLGLRVLNLSNNFLAGKIPSSLGNLARIESLDLSRNGLSGEIPQSLVGLTFLSFFDVSLNRLSGPIPRGNQLNTFENASYVGNPGLCGDPLTKRCGDSERKTGSDIDNSSGEEGEGQGGNFIMSVLWKYNWVVAIGAGYLVGVIIGVIGENSVWIKRRELWLSAKKRTRTSRRKKVTRE